MRRKNDGGALSESTVTPHADIVSLDSKAVSRMITHRGASRIAAAAVTEIAAGSRWRSAVPRSVRGPCADPDAFHRTQGAPAKP